MADRPTGYNAANRTDYVASDGSTQAMSSVLADRAAASKLRGRARDAAAHRIRQGMIGVLQSCLCDYPITRYETASGHFDGCPARMMFEALERADRERSVDDANPAERTPPER